MSDYGLFDTLVVAFNPADVWANLNGAVGPYEKGLLIEQQAANLVQASAGSISSVSAHEIASADVTTTLKLSNADPSQIGFGSTIEQASSALGSVLKWGVVALGIYLAIQVVLLIRSGT